MTSSSNREVSPPPACRHYLPKLPKKTKRKEQGQPIAPDFPPKMKRTSLHFNEQPTKGESLSHDVGGARIRVTATIPGKIMLAGEYSVLAGGHCLSSTVTGSLEACVEIDLAPRDEDESAHEQTVGKETSGWILRSNLWEGPVTSKSLTTTPLPSDKTFDTDLPARASNNSTKVINHRDTCSGSHGSSGNNRAITLDLAETVQLGQTTFGLQSGNVQISSSLDCTHGFGSSSALRLAVLFAMSHAAREKKEWISRDALGARTKQSSASIKSTFTDSSHDFYKFSTLADKLLIGRLALNAQKATQPDASGYDIATQINHGLIEICFTNETSSSNSTSWYKSLEGLKDSCSQTLIKFVHPFVGGSGAPTSKTMGSTLRWIRANEMMAAIRATSDILVSSFRKFLNQPSQPSLQDLVKAVAVNRILFEKSPNFPKHIADRLRNLPYYDIDWTFKTTGAGGEDAILLIGDYEQLKNSGAIAALNAIDWIPSPHSFPSPRSASAPDNNQHPKIRVEYSRNNLDPQEIGHSQRSSTTRSYRATAPSNIAFIKYWGKKNESQQWPANDSLSMTLDNSMSTTISKIIVSARATDIIRFNGSAIDTEKAQLHLDFLRKTLGFTDYLQINSSNSFPSSCGIASSASGMAALTIAAISAWTDSSSLPQLSSKGFNLDRLAQLSRQGSGSAGRSLWGGFVHWRAGTNPADQKIGPISSSEPAEKNRDTTSIQRLPPSQSISWDLADLIVVLSAEKKSISSSVAHRYAWSSPLFAPRISGIHQRLDSAIKAISEKDMPRLGEIIETEALEMHAVMMTSTPIAKYWNPETPKFISWVRDQRRLGDFPAWFTIDAGPNVHLICEKKDSEKIRSTVLTSYIKQRSDIEIIEDNIGMGPTLEIESPPPKQQDHTSLG